MPVVQNSYKIFKFPASKIAKENASIQGYTIAMGIRDGNVVSIGDNQVFQQIRYIKGDERDHHETFQAMQRMHRRMLQAQEEGDFPKARVYRQMMNETLFVREIVNVEVDGPKSEFKRFAKKGFDVNGRHYVYLCSGAGQIRRNTATFVDEAMRDAIVKNLNCGFDEKTDEYVLAKYTAYFALSFSSVYWVREPRVCVIKDFFRTVPSQEVDFIVRDSDDRKAEARMERRTMDIELNCADGQGLIDPGFAAAWSQDMDLPFVPCSFVARSAFIKGCLATFDFRAYAHEHGIDTIKDKWGVEYPVDEIDVLVSESQFKTHKYYSSWQEYLDYAHRGRVRWGVARYNKRQDPEWVMANYQYIQALTLSKEDVPGLIAPTMEWLEKVCDGDPLYSTLFMLGPVDAGSDAKKAYRRLYSSAQTTAMKAVVKNNAFLRDPYVKRKIRKNIKETINRAKIGKIWVRGNYEFLVSDPVAQCQAALGLDPVGVIPADHVWCDFWRRRFEAAPPTQERPKGPVGEGPWVDVCRSPMIDVHEHNPSTLMVGDAEADKWLSHLYSGCVLSTYDTSTARGEDCDFDGDIVLITDNKYFLKGSNKDHPIITYEKGLAKPAKINVGNLIDTICKGFGSGVGGFSNAATCMYAMAASFKEGDPRRDEIHHRIKLEREIVGQEIDRIKGAAKPYLPTVWRQIEKVPDGATPEEARDVYRRNSMALSKKPYFFRYLYPELDSLHKRFLDAYDRVSRDMFGIPFGKLLGTPKASRTKDQDDLVRRYEKYSPLINSPCTMNLLCRSVEKVADRLRFGRSKDGSREPRGTMLPDYPGPIDPEHLALVRKLHRDYNARRQAKAIREAAEDEGYDPDEFKEAREEAMDALLSDIRSSLAQAGIGPEECLRLCHALAKDMASFNWGFAWDALDASIIPLIPQGETVAAAPDPEGPLSYLGVRMSRIDATDRYEAAIEKLVRSVLGDYDYSRPPMGEEEFPYADD